MYCAHSLAGLRRSQPAFQSCYVFLAAHVRVSFWKLLGVSRQSHLYIHITATHFQIVAQPRLMCRQAVQPSSGDAPPHSPGAQAGCTRHAAFPISAVQITKIAPFLPRDLPQSCGVQKRLHRCEHPVLHPSALATENLVKLPAEIYARVTGRRLSQLLKSRAALSVSPQSTAFCLAIDVRVSSRVSYYRRSMSRTIVSRWRMARWN